MAKQLLVGGSLDIIDSYTETFKYALSKGMKSCQLNIVGLDIRDIITSRKLLSENLDFYSFFHSSVTHNLAGSVNGISDPSFTRKLNNTKSNLLHELDIATAIGSDLVVHIGTQEDKQIGISQIINTLNEILISENSDTYSFAKRLGISTLDFKSKRKILLENAAGKGNELGMTLDEISIILSQINPRLRDNLNVCYDTCHSSDAGQYDFGISGSTYKFFKDFDEKIGNDKLKLFHLNDSKNPYGSRKDRHENLGYGYIFGKNEGLTGLKELLEVSKERNIPLVLETPNCDIDFLLKLTSHL